MRARRRASNRDLQHALNHGRILPLNDDRRVRYNRIVLITPDDINCTHFPAAHPRVSPRAVIRRSDAILDISYSERDLLLGTPFRESLCSVSSDIWGNIAPAKITKWIVTRNGVETRVDSYTRGLAALCGTKTGNAGVTFRTFAYRGDNSLSGNSEADSVVNNRPSAEGWQLAKHLKIAHESAQAHAQPWKLSSPGYQILSPVIRALRVLRARRELFRGDGTPLFTVVSAIYVFLKRRFRARPRARREITHPPESVISRNVCVRVFIFKFPRAANSRARET